MTETVPANVQLKISVITIVRNGQQFIEQTIASVLNQTYDDVQYIVIDGASTDGTTGIIKSYESELDKWISEPDEGIADAFNKGLSYATGDYVLFLNADDALADQDVLSAVAKEIFLHMQPELIYGDYDILDRGTGTHLYRSKVNFSPDKVQYGQVIPHPCLFTRRSYFDKYGKFDTRFRIAMDYEWLLRGVTKVRIVHMPLLVTHIRNGGFSTQDRQLVTSEIIAALGKNGYLASKWDILKIYGYFFSRRAAKVILKYSNLYGIFDSVRNRYKR